MSASALGGRSFRMSGRIFSGLLLSATLVPCQSPFTSEQMAGAKLKHFAKVDKNVYKGSKPTSDADFRLLQSLHVKYIVDLEILPFMTGLEQRRAKHYGITVIRGLMNASPVSPSKKHIDFVLATLRKDQPVYFHCKYGRDRTNVWEYPNASTFSKLSEEGNLLAVHPTVKPVALIADALLDCSARGDLVLDAFLGSGSTLIAAERTGRSCYGIELDAVYVDAAIKRWQRYTGDRAVHAVSGIAFDQISSAKTEVNHA